MRKLKIGYWPLSKSLNSAGDRRRIVFWARARGHILVTDLGQNVDVIVASENSDFNSPYFSKNRTPMIFDLVDAYLSPLNAYDDLARGFTKRLSGQISGRVKPFSKHVRDFCISSDAVICSSVEQEEEIKHFNSNTHVILDSHDEIPFIDPLKPKTGKSNRRQILWEGQPATIRGVKDISTVLSKVSKEKESRFDFVTDENYFLLLNRYLKRNTLSLIKRDLGEIANFSRIVPWTPGNLLKSAQESVVAMIPIDLSVPMQRLKPENRLLIMWRLGLPCLTSPSPAYIRVAGLAGVNAICANPEEWYENFELILNNPDYSTDIAVRGQTYLRENHTESILLNKWDKAIESVLG